MENDDKTQEQEKIVAGKVKEQLHVVWREGFEKDNGVGTPRFKPVPPAAFNPEETAEQALKRFTEKGLPGLKIENGELQQNINTKADNLVPELNEKLNGGPAKAYTEYMMTQTFTDVQSIEKGNTAIHEVWMNQNSWQKEQTPEIFVPYEQLPAAEKIKDLDVLEVGVKAKGEMTPEVQAVFNGYRAELEAQKTLEINNAKSQDNSNDLMGLITPSNQGQKPSAKTNVEKTKKKENKGPKSKPGTSVKM